VRRFSWFSLCLAFSGLLAASHARATGPLPAQGQAITTSNYRLDFFQGPVLASSRVTGLAGAYAGIAEGVDGDSVNAASPAVRVPWSVDWFDYDLSLGLTFPSSLRKTDFDNNGTTGFSYSDFLFIQAGANFQFGAWAFGLSFDTQTYHLKGIPLGPDLPQYLHANLMRSHALLARSFFQGQLVVGLGARIVSLDFTASAEEDESGESKDLFSTSGAGADCGVLWAPHAIPIRAGLSVRTPVRSSAQAGGVISPQSDGDTIIGTMYLPNSVELPWEVEAGFSLQLGPRPFNVPWINPRTELEPIVSQISRDRERRRGTDLPAAAETQYRTAEDEQLKAARSAVRSRLLARSRDLPRQYLLISTSLLLSGSVPNAVGLESFLRQQVERSGQHPSLTPRIGLEMEPIAHWLKVRAGSYLEPSRFNQGTARVHATIGFDLKTITWPAFGLIDKNSYWRIGGFFDGTRDYVGWSASIGVWH